MALKPALKRYPVPIVPDETTPSGYTYQRAKKPKPKRIWLAIIVCGIVAAFSVTAISLLLVLLVAMFTSVSSLISGNKSPAMEGSMIAIMLCLYNLVLFPIVMPVTWGGLTLTLGRLRWKGKSERKPYYVRGVLLGGVLVSLTTGIIGSLDGEILSGFTAALTGGFIGALAGAFCTYIFLLISRPASIIGDVEIEAFS